MSDPTKIAIEVDPTRQMMSGVAHHGHTPFECPIISHVEGNLWQGGCQSGLQLPPTIVHVISLYPWEAYRMHKDVRSQLAVVAYDAEPDAIAPFLDSLTDWVTSCIKDGPTLVHCQAGLNRSGLLAALVLMKLGRTAAQAIELLRATRSPAVLCNTSFVDWLMEREHE